jgi:hypothetical protein
MMATGSNPSVSVGRAPNHPPPVPTYGNKWVKRTYSSVKTNGAAAADLSFSGGEFGIPGTGSFYVDKLQVWNTSTVDGSINVSFLQGLSTDLGDDPVNVTEYGNAFSMAGVTFKVPLGHAKRVDGSSGSSNNLVTVFSAKASTTYVVHLHCWVSI